MKIEQRPETRLLVKSESRETKHIVDLSDEAKKYWERCTCEDHQLREVKTCKHVKKAQHYEKQHPQLGIKRI